MAFGTEEKFIAGGMCLAILFLVINNGKEEPLDEDFVRKKWLSYLSELSEISEAVARINQSFDIKTARAEGRLPQGIPIRQQAEKLSNQLYLLRGKVDRLRSEMTGSYSKALGNFDEEADYVEHDLQQILEIGEGQNIYMQQNVSNVANRYQTQQYYKAGDVSQFNQKIEMQHIEKQQVLNMNSGMDMGMLDYHDKMTDIEGYTDPGPEVDENDRSAFVQLDDGAAQADDTQFASVSNSAGFNANGPTASDFAVARVNPVNDPPAGSLFDNDPRALSERRSAVQAFDQDGAKKLHGDELPKAPAKSATHNPQIPGANDSVTFYGERPVFDPSNDPGGPDESITTARRVAEGERLKELENQGRGDGTTANEIRRTIDDQLYAERRVLPIRFIRGMQPSIDRIGALAEKFNKEISVSYSPTQWERVKTAYEALVAHTPEGLPDAAFSKLMRDRYVPPEDGTTEEEVRARADFQLFEQTANAANAKFNNYKRKRTANEAGMPPWQKPIVKKNKNRENRRRRLRQLRVKNV